MTKEDALAVIKQVCAAYRGTLAEHQQIQKAIEVIEEKKNK